MLCCHFNSSLQYLLHLNKPLSLLIHNKQFFICLNFSIILQQFSHILGSTLISSFLLILTTSAVTSSTEILNPSKSSMRIEIKFQSPVNNNILISSNEPQLFLIIFRVGNPFPDAWKDWRQAEKGMTEDEMVGWHQQLDGHEFEQAPGIGDGHRSLPCYSPWGHTESDTTEDWTELKCNFYFYMYMLKLILEKGSFHSNPKERICKECPNYHTIAFISHASKVMLKILKARLQQDKNHELPDVQAGLEKA